MNVLNRRMKMLAAAMLLSCSVAHAEMWCDMVPGWSVVTLGTKAENIMILGQLQGAPTAIWIQISDGTIGKTNVAMALSAQLTGQNLSLYVDSPTATCANLPSWGGMGIIRHIRIVQ